MKKAICLSLCLLWIFLLIPSNVFPEIIRKINNPEISEIPVNTDQTDDLHWIEFIFFQDDLEIAKQRLDETGNLIFQEGQIPNGPVREYYESGELMAEANYLNNNPYGTEKVYSKTGDLIEERNWKDGRMDGIRKKYYKNGNVLMEITYQEGKREGVSKHFYENGALAWEYNWINEKYDGLMKKYYDSGALSEEAIYTEGTITNLKKHNDQGALIWQRNFLIEVSDE